MRFNNLSQKKLDQMKALFANKTNLVDRNIFIKIDDTGRKGLENWSNPKYWYTVDQALKFEKKGVKMGLLPPKKYMVLDCDDINAVTIVEKIISTIKIDPLSWKTPHGKHFLFKFDPKFDVSKLPTSIVGENYNGFHANWDYKGFRKGHVTTSGRVGLKEINDYIQSGKVPELPIMLYPFVSKHVDFNDFSVGQRHSIMYRNWIPNLRRVFTNSKYAIKHMLYGVLIDYYGENPMSSKVWVDTNVDSSWDKGVIEPISFEKQGELTSFFATSKNSNIYAKILNYDSIYEHLITKFKLVRSEDFKIWYYNPNKRAYIEMTHWEFIIKHEISKECPNIKPTLLNDVCNGLQHKVPVIPDPITDKLIYFPNGVWDIANETFQEGLRFSKNIIPWDFDISLFSKKTMSPCIKEFFNNICSNEKGEFYNEIQTQIFELMGYTMTTITRYDVSFFLLGGGSNGKSMFVKLFEKLLGDHNSSSESLDDLSNETFSTNELHNKLANINADISVNIINDVSLFKKIVSGDTISAQGKFLKPYKLTPYSTLIFSANAIPYYRNDSNTKAMERRIRGIPFLNEFLPKTKIYARFNSLWKELNTPEIMQELIVLSCKALSNVLKNGGFTDNTITSRELESHRMKLSHVEIFINDYNLENLTSSILDISTQYSEYTLWAVENGIKSYTKPVFIRKFEKFYRDKKITIVKEHDIIDNKKKYKWKLTKENNV